MEFGLLDTLTLIGAVCLFLYGMKLMSEGLQKAAGDKLRNILALMTNNRFVGAFTGIFITALIQSSSATTVMIVSFVNAGLLSLSQSMAVIMGANVGTTATAWIISLLGFKVNMTAFSIPLIGLGVPLLFSKKNSSKSWGEFLIGFALLFLGLDYINKSVPDLQANPEIFSFLQAYTGMGYGSVLLFALLGTLITIVIQSSSATFAIVLVMSSKGWISFELAAAVVLGSNIGTCITPLIASISANVQAKRAAMGHLIFNVLGSSWALLFYSAFIKLIIFISNNLAGNPNDLMTFVENTDPTILNQLNAGTLDASTPENQALIQNFADMQYYVSFGLSTFHTVFNLINITIMIWFTELYVKIVTKLIPSKPTEEDTESQLKFISTRMLSTAELSILQAHKEIELYSQRTHRMFDLVRELYYETNESAFVTKFSRIQKYENISDRMDVEIATYLTNVAGGRLSDESKHQIQTSLRIITEIESVADSCYNLARTIQRRNQGKIEFTDDVNANIELMFNLVESAIVQMTHILGTPTLQISDVNKAQNLENEINNFRNQLKNQNILDLNEAKYPYATGVVYMDMIVECEKIGDYVVNVVEALADSKLYKLNTK
ncbi:MAG TPA: Na/Pi cotransporter family protein [Paludibacteraceae bacterium]|nr:Na/Pi cotransporter family protein [Paludibacteraceae bacterium]